MRYSDMAELSGALVHGLRALGVPPRSCILLLSDLDPMYVAATCAILLHGSVLVPVQPGLDEPSLLHIVRNTRARALLVGGDQLSKVQTAMVNAGMRDLVLVALGDGAVTTPGGAIPVAELIQAGRVARRQAAVTAVTAGAGDPIPEVTVLGPDDMSAVLYTSGSTGVPKGAIFTEALMMPTVGMLSPSPNDAQLLYAAPSHLVCTLEQSLTRGLPAA
jgi:long-subunit acyl-CoA synthetase (AMP-forming)